MLPWSCDAPYSLCTVGSTSFSQCAAVSITTCEYSLNNMHLCVLIDANKGHSLGFKCWPLEKKTKKTNNNPKLNFCPENDLIHVEVHAVHSHIQYTRKHSALLAAPCLQSVFFSKYVTKLQVRVTVERSVHSNHWQSFSLNAVVSGHVAFATILSAEAFFFWLCDVCQHPSTMGVGGNLFVVLT